MWFKQAQLFQLTSAVTSAQQLAERLDPLSFKACLPSMPSSSGWVTPLQDQDEEAPLARGLNDCIMIALQVEEKILPASVVNLTLQEKIKQLEASEGRKIRRKDKLSFKDDVIQTLLPRAFSKLNQVYAYIDTRMGWLILNTLSQAKTDLFLQMLKKSLGDVIEPFDVIKPAAILTHWLKNQDFPAHFSIEQACMLQDPNHQNRVIRCQQQNLFVDSIQSLVKDGCEVMQLALSWHDKLQFVLDNDFTLRRIQLTEDDLLDVKDELETKQQKFDADFILMTETFRGFIADLLGAFEKRSESRQKLALVG